MAAIAAAASLLAPENEGPALATFSIAALIGALVLHRFAMRRVKEPELIHAEVIDDAVLFDVATVLTRRLAQATSLSQALRIAGDVLTLELGAHGVALHGHGISPPHRTPGAERSVLRKAEDAQLSAGKDDAGFSMSVLHDGQTVAVLEFKGTALNASPASLCRLMSFLQAQLESVALREFQTVALLSPNHSEAGLKSQIDSTQLREESELLARDVRAEHKKRLELEESLALSREFIDAMGNVLFISNPERSHFEFLAGSVFDALGVTSEQFRLDSASLLKIVVEEDRQLLAERAYRERRLESVDLTYRINHPSKGLRWIRSCSRPRASSDGSLRVYGLLADVTEARQREVELERVRDEACAASTAKSQFMASMSHEIRTPMNGILGMTELLLGTTLNDRQRRFAKAVYRSAESLLEIINDILDFSKIEAGKFELAPVDFALRGIVEDTLELLAPRAHKKGLELSFHEAPGLPQMVHADPLRLRQVLTNLIANAIKFTEHGDVVVDLQHAPLPDDVEGQQLMLHFTVRDTGIGIEDGMLPRLFSAFTQVHGGMSRRYGGTGLGLVISKQLIEMMGGRIEVKSELGVGSEFKFSVPVGIATGITDSVMAELDGSELSAVRVLLVEDHEPSRTALENMLGAWGMNVTLAADGQQALDILRGNTASDKNFDLAVIDMHMPRLNGISLARVVQTEGAHRDMKLILLTSASSQDDVHSAKFAGFHCFVPKPVRKGELRRALLGLSAMRREVAPPQPRLRGNVLVIEDNPVNQEVIGQMLRQPGLRMHVASTAVRGLQALCEAHFDLVLMDIEMPGMDGIEALNWFRRGPNERFKFVTPNSVRVIAVTANALGGDEDRFLALGFNDYLSKPFRQSQLLAMLTKHLNAHFHSGVSGQPQSEVAAEPAHDPGTAPADEAGRVSTAEAVLDAGALDRLRELDPQGKNQLLARVVKAFETSTERLVPQLKDANRAAETATVRHVSHTLKSSSASIGAVKLSRMCAEIETMVRTDQLDGLYDKVDSMCAEIEVVLTALKRLPLDAKS